MFMLEMPLALWSLVCSCWRCRWHYGLWCVHVRDAVGIMVFGVFMLEMPLALWSLVCSC